MPRILSTDHPLVQATASLLSEDPSLTNAHLLRKLPAIAGASAVQEVPVTHFQRRVRQPAERLLRQQVTNGTGGELKPPAAPTGREPSTGGSNGASAAPPAPSPASSRAAGSVDPRGGDATQRRRGRRSSGQGAAPENGRPAREGDGEGRPRGERTAGGVSRARKAAVDEALVSAFQLGVAADSHRDVVEAYRRLQEIRREIQTHLSSR